MLFRSFLVGNPSDKTFTIPSIVYELYADGVNIGQGKYSTEDISMPGRAAIYPGAEIPLKNRFILSGGAVDSAIYQSIINGEEIDYMATGIITAETSWSLVEKEF